MKDVKMGMSHLKQHQKYPATKKDLVESCQKLSEFSEEDKKWFEEKLPEGTYKSADDVMQALGWNTGSAQMPA